MRPHARPGTMTGFSLPRRALLLGASCLLLPQARADGLASLAAFVRDARTGQAHFTQTVTTPAGEDRPARVRRSSGEFRFVRPGHFRFDYERPYIQQIIADGKTLWLYDVDLEQVTARPQAALIRQTPAALIASASDLGALEAEFALVSEPASGGLEWVRAVPRSTDGQLQQVRVGFSGTTLAALEILDSFGQRSMLEFSDMVVNQPIAGRVFEFEPPVGVTVLRE